MSFLLNLWAGILDRSPTIRIFGLDVGLSIITFILLTLIRYTAEHVMETVWGWPAGSAAQPSMSVSSIVHSTILCPALFVCLRSQPYEPHAKLDKAPLVWQKAVTALLQFCTGYMFYDGCVNILFFKFNNWVVSDWLFFGHHVATAWYMTTARVYKAGHQSAMMCMFLGECTNPFQNSHTIATAALALECCGGPRMENFHHTVELWFAFWYCFMRAIACPSVAVHMVYDLWKRGRKFLPKALLVLWTLLIWGVLIGSIPWIEECWAMLDEYKPWLRSAGAGGSEEL